MRALFVLLSVTSRLGLVAAVVLVTKDATAAAAVAAVTSLLTATTAWVRAELVGDETERAWSELVAAVRRWRVADLEIMREDEIGVLTLLDTVREAAATRSTVATELVASSIAVVVLGAAIGVTSPSALAVGTVATLVLLVGMVPLQRRQFAASQRGFDALAPLSRDVRALIAAAAELRVQRAEDGVASGAQEAARRVATGERVAARHGALGGLVPAMIAVGVAVVPRAWLDRWTSGHTLFELSALGAALVVTALSVVRTLEHRRRAAPFLRAFERVLAGAASSPEGSREVAFEKLELERVSVTHPGGVVAPDAVTFSISTGGVALVGPNGGGKSTTVRVALGLIEPTEGAVSLDGAPRAPGSTFAPGSVAYLPQRPYFEPGESLAWHLELVGVAPDAPWLAEAFERLDLQRILERRSGGRDPLTAPIGGLSGGERQRFLLARTLGRPSRLVVLDEPEAALDGGGRRLLGAWLAELARDRGIILVAHDGSFVPDGFVRVECQSRPAGPALC